MASTSKNRIGHTKKELIEAMNKSLGIVTKACQMTGIARSTFYKYYNEDPEFKKQADSCEDIAIDFAESQLHKQIQEGVPSSTIFFLKTKGKKRGYVEKTEMEHSGTIIIKPTKYGDTTPIPATSIPAASNDSDRRIEQAEEV